MTTATGVVVVFLSLLFNIGLISAIETHIYTSESRNCTLTGLNYRLPDHVVPRSYAIRLSMHSFSIDGKASIMIEIFNETSEISLNAHELYIDIETIELIKYTIDEHNETKVPKWYRYCNKPQVLFLTFDEILGPGIYQLNMEYSAIKQSDRGFVTTIHEEIKNEYVKVYEWSYVTIFDQTGARRVFPCWDEPTFKAIFNITVVHWSGQQVFSNMPYRRNTEVDDWNTETEFEPTHVIATYLVTIAIITSHQTPTNKNYIWFRTTLNTEMDDILRATTNRTEYMLRQYIGNIWKNSTIKIIAYPDLPSNVVRGTRFAIFRESDLRYEPEFHFIGRTFEIRKLITREVIRQCIETYVSPTEWSHMWLSKALGLYLSYDTIEEGIHKNMQMTDLFVVQILQPALYYDDTLNVPPVIHEYDPIYSILTYKKASALIRMMEHIVTKEMLQQAIAEYVETYAYRTATPNDFLKIVESKMNQLEKAYQYNIMKIMYTWLSQRKYPKLLIIQDTKGFINITTYNTKDIIDERNKWVIPVTYRTNNDTQLNQEFPEWWLDNNTHLYPIKLERNDWILFNVEHFGYYRVNYNNHAWLRIANVLIHKGFQKIHAVNRAQIVDDAYHFLMVGEMDFPTYATMTHYLMRETDFIVWHSMMNVLQYMSHFFNFAESQSFKDRMLFLMHEVLTKIGYDEDPNNENEKKEVHALRLLLLKWSCQHGRKECREKANYKLVAYINDPLKNRILPGWRDWMYCAGLMKANKTIWNRMQHDIVKGNDSRMLQHLACNDNVDMIIEHLKSIAMKSSYEWIRLNGIQRRELYHAIVKKHARKKKVLNFLLENFNRIFPRDMSVKQILVDIIMSVYAKCQLRKIYKFVHENPNLDKKMSDEVMYFVSMRIIQTNEQKKLFVNRIPAPYSYSGEC